MIKITCTDDSIDEIHPQRKGTLTIAEHIYLETAELFLYGNDYGFPPEAGGEQQQAVV